MNTQDKAFLQNAKRVKCILGVEIQHIDLPKSPFYCLSKGPIRNLADDLVG